MTMTETVIDKCQNVITCIS